MLKLCLCATLLFTPVLSAQILPEAPAPATLIGTPGRILHDELHILTSPARLRRSDLPWLVPVSAATAASLVTDTHTLRSVVSHDPTFNNASDSASGALRDVFLAGPAALFAVGHFTHADHPREAGILAGEAIADAYIADLAIKYVTLRERPTVGNARGHFFQTDAASDPSFVSGHAVVAWSSAAVLAAEYPKAWQQIGLYTLATGTSLTRVLAQQHFPTDVLLGSATGWLIGRYVSRAHRYAAR